MTIDILTGNTVNHSELKMYVPFKIALSFEQNIIAVIYCVMAYMYLRKWKVVVSAAFFARCPLKRHSRKFLVPCGQLNVLLYCLTKRNTVSRNRSGTFISECVLLHLTPANPALCFFSHFVLQAANVIIYGTVDI